jgi:hypothetical protein
MPSGRPSKPDITQNEALFRLIQEGRHVSLYPHYWGGDPYLFLNPPIGSDEWAALSGARPRAAEVISA